jgi:predicted CXXCH cytochrome family protein
VRALCVIVLLGGCASPHPPPVDRTDCSDCHTVPAAAEMPPSPCMSLENPHHGSTANVAGCADCHGTVAWCPAEVTHTDFALEGDHAGWDCADCHRAISYEPPAMVTDATQFTCISCHWHSAARTDPFHLGKGDYEYGPETCLAEGCHDVRAR